MSTPAEDVRKIIGQRMPKSKQAFERGKKVLATMCGMLPTVKPLEPHPFLVKETKGSKIIDLDGNEYVDLTMCYGPLFLGHSPKVVVDAVIEGVKKGTSFALPHEQEIKLAELMVEAIPCAEKVAFVNSGTEATLHAIRMCRAFTGKDMIAKFEGGYHGSHDYVLASGFFPDPDKIGTREDPQTVADTIGIPAKTLENTIILPRNHPAAFDKIRKYKDKLAVVMIEAVPGPCPVPMGTEFLSQLKKVCQECNVLFLMDEVITGFRLAYGGAQELYGVTPDLATYGKIIGGGLPVGGIAGRDDVMAMITPTGDPLRDKAERIFYGGTFNSNYLTCCAGAAAIGYIKEHKEIYAQINGEGERIRKEVNTFAKDEEVGFQMLGVGSFISPRFVEGEVTNLRDFYKANFEAELELPLYLLKHGVFLPGLHIGFVSAAHTKQDVDKIIGATKNALSDMRKAGLC